MHDLAIELKVRSISVLTDQRLGENPLSTSRDFPVLLVLIEGENSAVRSIMRLPIETGTVKFVAAGPAEPVLDYETRAPKLDASY